jgi:hypothetical protein
MIPDFDPDWEDTKAVLTNPRVPHRLWTCADPRLTGREQKQYAEFEVTTQFCEALEAVVGEQIFKRTIKINQNDPPDTIVEKLDGTRIGVELTELLDEGTQKERVQMWRKHGLCSENKRREPEEYVHEIQKRIEQKNESARGKEMYDHKILVIYTVEISARLNFRSLAATLSEKEFGPVSHFAEVFFLTPQAPMQRHPQILRLKLKAI